MSRRHARRVARRRRVGIGAKRGGRRGVVVQTQAERAWLGLRAQGSGLRAQGQREGTGPGLGSGSGLGSGPGPGLGSGRGFGRGWERAGGEGGEG